MRWAYSNVMNNGERADRPDGNGLLGPQEGTLGRWIAGSNARLLAVLLSGLLLGFFLFWVFSLTPSEQRTKIAERDDRIRALQGQLNRVDPIVRNMAEHEQSIAAGQAALDAREAEVAQREQVLANRWSIPKLTAQHVESFLRRTSDSISRLFRREKVPCRC